MTLEHPKTKQIACVLVIPGQCTTFELGGRLVIVGATQQPEHDATALRNYILYPHQLAPPCHYEDIWVVVVTLWRAKKSGRKPLFIPRLMVCANAAVIDDAIKDNTVVYMSGPFSSEEEALEVADGVMETAISRFLALPRYDLENLAPLHRRQFAHLAAKSS